MTQDHNNPADQNQSAKPATAINEESGIGWQGIAHGAGSLGLLTLAFNLASGGNELSAVAGMVAGVGGLALAANTAFSTWFAQKENHATITTFFGKKMGNITGGGIKFKKPWPWRSKYETVPVYVQNEEVALNDLKTKDGVFIENLKFQIFFKIVDPGTFVFSDPDRVDQMKARVANSLRAKVSNSVAMLSYMAEVAAAEVGEDGASAKASELANALDLYGARQEISETVMEEVNESLARDYGIEIVDVPIEEPKLDRRFVEAAARRMEQIQDGLARKEFLRLEGEGYSGQREAMLLGYAVTVKALVDNYGYDKDVAQSFVEFMIDRETLRDAARNHATIIRDNGTGTQSNLPELMAFARQFGINPQHAADAVKATGTETSSDTPRQGPAPTPGV